jgi:membrane-associated protein
MSLDHFIESLGYVGIWGIIFSECGILFGILLPGDSLLFSAGVLCAQGFFNIWVMMFGCFSAALMGNIVGYEVGSRLGMPFLRKYASSLVSHDRVEIFNKFLKQYGFVTITATRFIPVLRTISPILAGVYKMPYHEFVTHSVIGAILWGAGLPAIGYFLGNLISKEVFEILVFPASFVLLIIIAWPVVMWIRQHRKGKENKNTSN